MIIDFDHNPNLTGDQKLQSLKESVQMALNEAEAKASTSGLIDMFYPVGSYYETSDRSFNPNTAWGGTWTLETSGAPKAIENISGISGLSKATQANAWYYTGVSFTVPDGHRYLARVSLGYTSAKPIGVGCHTASSLNVGFPYYNVENSNGVSHMTQLLSAGTYYVFEKRVSAPASNNTITVAVTDFDFSTTVYKWHRTA